MAGKKSFKGTGADLFLSLSPEEIRPTVLDAEQLVQIKSEQIMELKINPVFEALIPPLSPEEYAQLENNLLQNGIREAISIWGNVIIDGHNRYSIATKHNLPYSTISYEFDNEDSVKLWIFENQIGRRNLPAYERVKLALLLKPVITEKAKQQQLRKPSNPSDAPTHDIPDKPDKQSKQSPPLRTLQVIADMAGVSHDTVSKVEKILEVGIPEVLDKLTRGDVTINKAYEETKQKAQKPKDEDVTKKLHGHGQDIGTYSVIYADPKWEVSGESLGAGNDIKTISVPAADDAILFLWSADSTLDKALRVMSAWGFKYKTSMVWDRRQAGAGQYVRGQHDVLLIGIRGKFDPPGEDARVGSVRSERVKGADGKKPKWFYEQIERMFPDHPLLEMFANERHSERWTLFHADKE